MDGCSSGTDSHFASTLIGKILRKIAKEQAYKEFVTNETLSLKILIKNISLKLFEELQRMYNLLDLRSDEILSTMILSLVDTINYKAEAVIVGDGFIHVNGKNIEYENDNKPDYIGYHLGISKEIWFDTKTQKLSVENIEDLTISTDGIHTFKNFDGKNYDSIIETEIFKQFFENKEQLENSNKLKKTLLFMKDRFGLMPSDDLTMIRVIKT